MDAFLGDDRGGLRGDGAGRRTWADRQRILGARLLQPRALARMEGLEIIRDHWLTGVLVASSYAAVFICAARSLHG